jgi:hypothetical protein
MTRNEVNDVLKNGGYYKLYAMADELAEYKSLDDQGLLVRLPCKIGDTIKSDAGGSPFGDIGEMPFKVVGISVNLFGDWGGLTQHKTISLDEFIKEQHLYNN